MLNIPTLRLRKDLDFALLMDHNLDSLMNLILLMNLVSIQVEKTRKIAR